MREVQIPKDEQGLFVEIFHLDAQAFNTLISLAADMSVGTSLEEAERVFREKTDVQEDILEVFTKLLFSIGHGESDTFDPYLLEFQKIYIDYLLAVGEPEKINEEEFVKRFKTIYKNTRSIRLSSKISDTKTLFGNYVTGMTLQPDIKPVRVHNEDYFNFVISFSLKLVYDNYDSNDEEKKMISLVLDQNDLNILQGLIEEAEKTVSQLAEQFAKGGGGFVDLN